MVQIHHSNVIELKLCSMFFLIKLDTAPQYILHHVRGRSLTTLTRRGRFDGTENDNGM